MKIYRCKKCQFDLIKTSALQYKCPVCGSSFSLEELSNLAVPLKDLYNELVVAVKKADENNINRIIKLLELNSPNNPLINLFKYFTLNKSNLISLDKCVRDFIEAKLDIASDVILGYAVTRSNSDERVLLREIFNELNINIDIPEDKKEDIEEPMASFNATAKDVLICYHEINKAEAYDISNKLDEYNVSYRLIEIADEHLEAYLASSKLLVMVVSKNIIQSKPYLSFIHKANLLHQIKKINYIVTDLPILVKHKYNKNKLIGIELFMLKDIDSAKLSLYILQGLGIDLAKLNKQNEEPSINEAPVEDAPVEEEAMDEDASYEDTLDNNDLFDDDVIDKIPDEELDSEGIESSEPTSSTPSDDDSLALENANKLYEDKKYSEALALLNNLSNRSNGIELMTRIYSNADYEGKDLNIAYNLVRDGHDRISTDLINEVGKLIYNEKKAKEARDCFRLAGRRDDIKALFNLGIFALNGIGGDKDLREASDSFLKVISSGDDMAKYYYAIINLDSSFEGANTTEAIKYLEELAESGMAMAQYRLGTCYYYGQGVPKRLYLAKEWLEKASENGNKQASNFIEQHLPN